MSSPALTFRSIYPEFAHAKIGGGELARELHDLHCENAEKALSLAATLSQNLSYELTRADKQVLKLTCVGKTILARYFFSEGSFRHAALLFDEAYHESSYSGYLFERTVVYFTKALLEAKTESKSVRTLSRNGQKLAAVETDLLKAAVDYDHAAAFFLSRVVEEAGKRQIAVSYDKEVLLRALEATATFNVEDLAACPRAFGLENMKQKVRKFIKDPLVPNHEILPVISKKTAKTLLLDVLSDFRKYHSIRADDCERLTEIYRLYCDDPSIATEALKRELFEIGNPDLVRFRLMQMFQTMYLENQQCHTPLKTL